MLVFAIVNNTDEDKDSTRLREYRVLQLSERSNLFNFPLVDRRYVLLRRPYRDLLRVSIWQHPNSPRNVFPLMVSRYLPFFDMLESRYRLPRHVNLPMVETPSKVMLSL